MPLLRNPLTMRGSIEWCYLLTFRTPAAEARALLPPELEPVTKDGWAFWNMVVCEISAMRPAFLPSPLGLRYRHVAYRLYARFITQAGEDVEGLYFLRSDCNTGLMSIAGNALTDFNFHTAPITRHMSGDRIALEVRSPDAPAHITLNLNEPAALSEGSPFASVADAAAFLKYKPRGLSVDPVTRDVNVVQIVRDEALWRGHPVAVTPDTRIAYLTNRDVRPEICYAVDPIRYQWNRGRDFCAVQSLSE